MITSTWTVPVLRSERKSAEVYAKSSKDFTLRKLEQQQSRFSNSLRMSNIVVGGVARRVIARVLREHGIPTECDQLPHTEWKHYCLVTPDGWFIQTRYIENRLNYQNLLEDVRSFGNRPHDFYVAATSRDSLVTLEIIGYATRDEMSYRKPRDFGQGIQNRYVPLSRLHPFGELLQVLLEQNAARPMSQVRD